MVNWGPLVAGVLVAAALVAVVWLRTGRESPRPGRRGRRRELAWCVAALLLAVALAGNGQPGTRGYAVAAPVLAVTASVLTVMRPKIAYWLVVAELVALGGYAFAAARDYGFWHRFPGSFAYLTVGSYDTSYYLVLPLAYGLPALAGWLAWRAADHQSSAVAVVLGGLARPSGPERRWGLLLLPVVMATAVLLAPGAWLGGGLAGLAGTVAVLLGTFLVIRRWPAQAGAAATLGLIALGLAGLVLARSWVSFPVARTPDDYVLDGLVADSGSVMSVLAFLQALVMLAAGLWLVTRTLPQARRLLGLGNADLARRVQRLTESRAVAVDTAAADLRRLERDLHNGAQARLVALGMNLRTVERLIPVSPEAALALVAEARETSARALTELRELVRGVHPPVLADRGLGDAVRALALDAPMRIETEIDLPGHLAAPVETACYFAVAEVLTNAVKHSGAREGRVCVTHADRMLRIEVTDFGIGGADPAAGTGLAGVEKRLATFDGIMAVSSPPGGPTIVVMEVPCALSSPRISSS